MEGINGNVQLPLGVIISVVIVLAGVIAMLFKILMKNKKQDTAMIIEMTTKMTDVVANSNSAIREHSETSREMKHSIDKLTEQIFRSTK